MDPVVKEVLDELKRFADVKETQKFDLAIPQEAWDMAKKLESGNWIVIDAFFKNSTSCPLVFKLGRIEKR